MGRQANILGGIMLLYTAVLRLAALDTSGWSLLAAPVGLIALFLWKPFRKNFPQRHKSGETMRFSDFLMLLSLTLGTQLVAQLGNLFLPGKHATEYHGLVTFLYVCFFAPVGEELLFRGLLLRSLEQHNKKLALFASALLFALLHGNIVQLPYAFLLGIVLGYTAMTYGLFWSLVLHILNNLLFGYVMPCLLTGLPNLTQSWAFWGVAVAFAVVSTAILAANCVKIHLWLRKNRIDRGQLRDFFGAPTVCIFMLLTMLLLFIR